MKDDIRRHLSSKAEGMHVEVPDQPKKGSRSQAPLAAAAAAMAMVLAVGITVPLVSGGDDSTDLLVAESDESLGESSQTQDAVSAPRGAGSSVSPEAVAAGEGPTLNWQQGAFPDAAFVHGATAFDSGFLAWGTESAPLRDSDVSPSFAIWFSDDGSTWEHIDSSGFDIGQNEWLGQVISVDGLGLVAVGNGFDPPEDGVDEEFYAPEDERTIIWSSTDGLNWARTEFERDLPTSDTPGEMWFGGQPLVASSGGRVVMVQSYMLEFDPYSIVEQELSDRGLEFHGLGMDEDGVEVFSGDEAEELIAQFTYEELGIDPSLFREGPGPSEARTSAYISEDGGSSWTRSNAVGLDDLGYLNGVVGTDTGFLAVGDTRHNAGADGGPATWISTDGVNWTKVSSVGSYVYNLAAFGDLIVAPGDRLVLSRDGGSSWNTLTGPAFDDVDGLRFNVDQAAVGPFGIVATGTAYSEGPPPPDLVLEKDGLIYRESYDENYEQTVSVTDAATGDVLLEIGNYFSPEWIVENKNESFTVLDPESGEEVITIGYRDFEGGHGLLGEIVTVEVDGLVYTEDWENDRITVTNAETGEVVVDILNARQPAHMRQEDDGFTLLDPTTGEDLMSILFEEMEAAYEDQYREEDFFEQPVMAIWYSQDGTAWSRQDMRQAFGDSGYMSGLVSGEDRVVAVFMPEPEFYPESEEEELAYVPPPSQVWVGTLGG